MPTMLTDTLRVASLLKSGTDATSLDEHNELLETLVVEVSDAIERYLDRTIAQATYTHYFDGTGRDTLVLREGPLVSVTSLESVDYYDAGSGARGETLTAINPYEYVMEGQRSEGCVGLGVIRLVSGCFYRGRRNYKVVYSAGWTDSVDEGSTNIPQAIVAQATREVAARFNLRTMDGLSSRTVGTDTTEVSTQASIPALLDEARKRALAAFRIPRVG